MENLVTGDEPWTVEKYFALIEKGYIAEDDRVELLDGIIVAAPQQGPLHSGALRWADHVLRSKLGPDVVVSIQSPMIAGVKSAPEPDIALLPGRLTTHLRRHPESALLALEISVTTLSQDRLTKSRIYAGANVFDYWILNLRGRCVEWHSDPDPVARVYRSRGSAAGEDRLRLRAFPKIELTAGEILPPLDDD